MRTTMKSLVAVFVTSGLVTLAGFGQDKLAQTGMKFLSVGTDARASAMAEAVTAVEGYSSSMFFNPAGMASLKSFVNFSLGQTRWIADIDHNFASVAISPFGGDYGVLGFTIQSVDYGELQETIRADNEQGFLDLGTFEPTAIAVGIGYARALSEKFSVGGDVRYVRQDLGSSAVDFDADGNVLKLDNAVDVFAFDFGILYRTGFRSLNFGMTVRNFSREIRYQKESFQLPLTFKLGISMDVADILPTDNEMHSILLSVEASHPRDYAEQLNIGAEYTFMQIVSLRGGYLFNNREYDYTLGFGLQKSAGRFHLGLDYAYTSFEPFDNVQRFSLQFSL